MACCLAGRVTDSFNILSNLSAFPGTLPAILICTALSKFLTGDRAGCIATIQQLEAGQDANLLAMQGMIFALSGESSEALSIIDRLPREAPITRAIQLTLERSLTPSALVAQPASLALMEQNR